MNTVELLKNILQTQNVDVYSMSELCEQNIVFDGGIRKKLLGEYDYRELADEIKKTVTREAVHVITDPFQVKYIFFPIPADLTGCTEALFIGPYQSSSVADVEKIQAELHLPLFSMSILKNYYYEVPVMETIEVMIQLFMDAIYGKDCYEIYYSELNARHIISEEVVLSTMDDVQILTIEELYQREEKMLKAIHEGNISKAYLALSSFGKYRAPERVADKLQNSKNLCLVTNTLFRKEVQNAHVHPAHIDEVSSLFAKRIGNARNVNELSNISSEMIRKYCLLVQNYSLKGYSEVVRDTINYVDFHMQEPLGLQLIADYLCVNASYLSRLFKKETQKTLTEYINEKRLEKSLEYLTVTNLPIQEVAARVGIFDENYFSRIFKKAKNLSPREYRQIMKNE